MKSAWITTIIVLILVVAASGRWLWRRSVEMSATPIPSDTSSGNDQAVFCTQDAKQCPDGSYVGRVPPTCEFEACQAGAPYSCEGGECAPVRALYDTESWQIYRDDNYGFELKYPNDSNLNTLADGITRVALSIKPGTNLISKELQIYATAATSCDRLTTKTTSVVSDTGSKVINGVTFSKKSGIEGAMNQIYETTQYTTTHGSSCINLTFTLHLGNLGVYDTDPPTVPFDRTEETWTFSQILATFEFLE